MGQIFRIVFLIGALIGVIYFIKQLNTHGVNKDLLFLDETTTSEMPESVQAHSNLPEFNLCETRVKDIQFNWNGKNYNIYNSGKQWKANELDLPPVEMEKWLVLLCRVKAERLIDLATSTQKYVFPDQIVFQYVNGQSLMFGIETPAFKFGDKGFYSRQFLEMINNLKTMISKPSLTK